MFGHYPNSNQKPLKELMDAGDKIQFALQNGCSKCSLETGL
jgi:hypothetical protein